MRYPFHAPRRAIALAAALALLPAAQAAQRHWTFIGGCASADWFGMIGGPNSEGQLTCWAQAPGGSSGMPAPLSFDDAFIQHANPGASLLVNLAAPVRGDTLTAQANHVTLAGSSSFAVGLAIDRSALTASTLALGLAGQDRLGAVVQSAGRVSLLGSLDVLAGEYQLRGGTLTAPGTLNLRGQRAAARFTQTGGTLTAGIVNVGSELGAAASFSQLAGTVSSLGLNLGTLPGSTVATVSISGVDARWTNGAATTVGLVGGGALTVSNGARATTGSARIGSVPGGNGVVTVQGKGSRWSVGELLEVGVLGGAELKVLQGAAVDARNVRIDTVPAVGPSLLVDGVDSMIEVANAVTVGSIGTGSLALAGGGRLTAAFGVVGADRRSVGSVDVSGAGSEWRNGTSLVVGDRGRGTFTVGAGGRVSLPTAAIGLDARGVGSVTLAGEGASWTTSGSLMVGQGGRGTLKVETGARVDSATATVGFAVGSQGTADVAGGTWANFGRLRVGQGGSGSLTVGAAGTLSSGELALGEGDASSGELAIAGADSFVALAGALLVAGEGQATLALRNQARLESGSAAFGGGVGGVGSGTIGNRARWINRNDLVVGDVGEGLLDMDGADAGVQTGALAIGRKAGSKGTVNLVNGSLAVDRDATIGAAGSGHLNILAGGTTIVGGATVLGTFGQLTLDGGTLRTGSLAMPDPARMQWHSGTLDITGSGGIALGGQALARRLALQTGQTLVVANTLTVGDTAELQLAGGRLNVGTLALEGGGVRGATLAMGSIGTLSGRGRVDAAVDGGPDSRIQATGALALGSAASVDGFDYRGTLEVGGHAVSLADADLARLGALTTLAAGGALSSVNGILLAGNRRLEAQGDAAVQGAFVNNGTVDATAGALRFAGDVSGNGSFAGTLAFDAGFAPGQDGIAAVSFGGGSAQFGAGSMLTLEIAGTSLLGGYDRLTDLGTLDFGGHLTLAFGAGFQPTGNTTRLMLLDFETFAGGFDPAFISVTGIDTERYLVDTSRLATTGSLFVQSLAGSPPPVPEPGTMALWLAGLAAVGWRARRAGVSRS